MVDFNEFLAMELWNNTGQTYIIAVLLFIMIYLILALAKRYIIVILKRLAKKSKNQIDDILVRSWENIHPPFYFFIALYVSTRHILLPDIVDKILFYIFLVAIVYYVIRFIQGIIDHFVDKEVKKRHKEDTYENTSMIKNLGMIIKITLWVVAFLFLLSNLGVNITPLIAGLGVGGVAIAFALQNILEDLFSSFSIYFDKPFKEGHFIIIGNDMGVVKHIGIKTTRIQTLQGQELVVSNRELTSTRINNYKQMEKRRIVFAFGVEYDTPNKKMKKINGIVENIMKGIKLVKLDRVHFKDFGDFSLNYEAVYYLDSSDYNKYMDVQQEINLKLKEAFEKEKIVFAFPTQTIMLQK